MAKSKLVILITEKQLSYSLSMDNSVQGLTIQIKPEGLSCNTLNVMHANF